jgi:hypothetical protein
MLLLNACYQSVPVSTGVPSVEREVVVELNERGSLDLAPLLGAQLKEVHGRVVSFSNGIYELSVSQTVSRGGVETLWRGENASIRSDYVRQLQQRELDGKRTTIVTVATVTGVLLLGTIFGFVPGVDGLIGGGGGSGTKK